MLRQLNKSDLADLLDAESGLFCAEGIALLRSFSDKRPQDFAFLVPDDLSSMEGSAFAGIEEWDAFSNHCRTCRQCHV